MIPVYLALAAGAALFFAAGYLWRKPPKPERIIETERVVQVQVETQRVVEPDPATEARVRELTAQLRDLSAQHEQQRGRLADADALRAEYVRLRTAVTEQDFLRSEVKRLEQELRDVKLDALGAPLARRRAPRGSVPSQIGSIGDSLARAIDRFADAGTRGSAIADALGFPLAASSEDGHALAAFGALAFETANRAAQFLPLGPPAAIEIVDERGARASVWTFDVDASDGLLFVNLAVAPVDPRRVERTLGELSSILAPTGHLARLG